MMPPSLKLLLPGSLLLAACGGATGLDPRTLVEREPPEDFEPPDEVPRDQFLQELLDRASTQTCAVHGLVATREGIYDTQTESLIHEVDQLSRTFCEAGVDRFAVGWGADGAPSVIPDEESRHIGDVMILGAEFDERFEHSGEQARDGVACGGRVGAIPDLTVYATEGSAGHVRLEADHPDAFLWLRSPDGEDRCTNLDDAESAETVVLVGGFAGEYQIWVGALSSEQQEWTLQVEEPAHQLGGARAWTPGMGQDIRVDVQVGPFHVAAPSDSHQYCSGYIGPEPSLDVFVTNEAYGFISVESDADPVLYMEGPNGEIHCNDDYNGVNPGVSAHFTPGIWRVYVGSYGGGAQFPTTLILH